MDLGWNNESVELMAVPCGARVDSKYVGFHAVVCERCVIAKLRHRIAALESQLAQYRWRRVEDEIPPDEVQVLVRVKWSADPTRTGFLDEGTWVVNGYGSGYVVTHWMPLPPAPEEGE